ncbi:hypothetical protein RCL1_002544 [Eukaryota sp. TZLM3-RCL]
MYGYLPSTPPRFRYSPTKKRPIKLYNYDGAKAPLIYLFRNGEYHATGVPFAVNPKNIHNMNHLYSQTTAKLRPFTGPVRKICTVEGFEVENLCDFQDRLAYILLSGEEFDHSRVPYHALKINQEQLLVEATRLKMSSAPFPSSSSPCTIETFSRPRPSSSSLPRPVLETVSNLRKSIRPSSAPLTTLPTSFSITIYENGFALHEGITINVTKDLTKNSREEFINLLHLIRTELDNYISKNQEKSWNFQDVSDHRLFTGRVTSLYNSNRNLVKGYSCLLPDHSYVAVRNFDPLDVTLPLKMIEKYEQEFNQDETNIEESNEIDHFTSSQDVSDLTEPPLLSSIVSIFVFKNGCVHDSALKVVINRERIRTVRQLFIYLTECVKYLNTGVVRNIYNQKGEKVKNWSMLRHLDQYILTGAENLDLARLPSEFKVVQGSKLHLDLLRFEISPKNFQIFQQTVSETPILSHKPPQILIFKDGEIHDRGQLFIVLISKFKSLDVFIQHVRRKLHLASGPIIALFDLCGRKINNLDQLDHEGWYIASSGSINTERLPFRITEFLRKTENRSEYNEIQKVFTKTSLHKNN